MKIAIGANPSRLLRECRAGASYFRLVKNGTTEIAGTSRSAAPGCVTCSNTSSATTVVSLAANDYISLQGSANSTSITIGLPNDGGGFTTMVPASLTIVRLQ